VNSERPVARPDGTRPPMAPLVATAGSAAVSPAAASHYSHKIKIAEWVLLRWIIQHKVNVKSEQPVTAPDRTRCTSHAAAAANHAAAAAGHDSHKNKTARELLRWLIQRKGNVKSERPVTGPKGTRPPAAPPLPATTATKQKLILKRWRNQCKENQSREQVTRYMAFS